MSPQPPRKSDAKAGGRGLEPNQMERFRKLAKRLVRVSRSELENRITPAPPDNLEEGPEDLLG